MGMRRVWREEMVDSVTGGRGGGEEVPWGEWLWEEGRRRCRERVTAGIGMERGREMFVGEPNWWVIGLDRR